MARRITRGHGLALLSNRMAGRVLPTPRDGVGRSGHAMREAGEHESMPGIECGAVPDHLAGGT